VAAEASGGQGARVNTVPPLSDEIKTTIGYMCACRRSTREYDFDAGVMKACTLCVDRPFSR
jgi:hypothetical protein